MNTAKLLKIAYSEAMPASESRQFIEDFALVMTNAGMQRMASRAFAALLASETGALTARELAEVLEVSPAAVSGATKYLEQARLVRRARTPGERVDHFVLGDDAWYTAMTSRTEIFAELNRALESGIAALPKSSGARDRLAETRDFFAYVNQEMPKMVERWHAERGTG